MMEPAAMEPAVSPADRPAPLHRARHAIAALFRYSPTRRLALVLAASAPVWMLTATLAGQVAAALVVCAIVIAVIADTVSIPGRNAMRVSRRAPPSVGLDETMDVEWDIESRWTIPVRVEVHDHPGVGFALRTGAPAAVAGSERSATPWKVGELVVPAGGRVSLAAGLTGIRRGIHRPGPIVLRVHGRLGLVRRSLEYVTAEAIAVVPSIAGIRRYRLLAVQHRLRDMGIRTIRRRGEGRSFASLREYVAGDDPRHVDWKATARRGKLMTREYTVEQGQTVVIAIDAGRMMTQLSGRVSRFEQALASAGVLADVATRSGDYVALLVFDDVIRAFVPAAKGSLAVRRIRDALLPLEASMMEPDYAGAFRALSARHRKRSLIVLYTDVIDPRASRAVIAHTIRSARRHLPLVVALRNDELVTASLPQAGSRAGLFRTAAAEELLLEREEALAAMRRAGVSVLDVSPRVMTAAVLNRYLSIKARSAL
jgi:uncharacterized protein (DUF58 family)